MEFLKPRRMENGCEYYLAGEVVSCIEQAALQMTESNSVYKELNSIINRHKYKRCINMVDKCGQAVSRYLAEGRLYEIDSITAEGERHNELLEQVKDCDRKVTFYDRWYHRWSEIAAKFELLCEKGINDYEDAD